MKNNKYDKSKYCFHYSGESIAYNYAVVNGVLKEAMNTTDEDYNFKEFKYFIEVYFNLSMDYADLEKLVDDFLENERKNSVMRFAKEVKKLYVLNDPEFIKNFVFIFGHRALSLKKANDMIEMMFKKINEFHCSK